MKAEKRAWEGFKGWEIAGLILKSTEESEILYCIMSMRGVRLLRNASREGGGE